jgi:hypothetical protein
MASYIDHEGNPQVVDLQGALYYKMAADKGLSLRQFINSKHTTRPQDPDAFQQMCIAAGLRFKADDDHGVPASTMKDILDPSAANTNQVGGTFTSAPEVPDSRILFPAALMEAMEDALEKNRPAAVSAFEDMVGYKKTIASDRYERPYISYGGASGPEDSAFQRVAQNARPPLMLSITASDVTKTIPTTAVGLEISHKAMAESSLDLVALTMTRFMQVADYNEWIAQLLLIYAGDPDAVPLTPIATGASAITPVTAQTYDSLNTVAGSITQLAWLNYLYHDNMTMQKTHMIMNFATAIAIDTRTNRPTNVMNNSIDRIDVPFVVAYPDLGSAVKFVIMPSDAGWTSNIALGLDKAYALAKITSSTISYSAVEDIVMKRSREFRFDRGFVVERLFDDAFDGLSLAVA